MSYFLLHYDNEGDVATVRRFEERDAAVKALHSGTLAKLPKDELVLFITDSEETLRRTHPRYFYSEAEMARHASDRILQRLAKQHAALS